MPDKDKHKRKPMPWEVTDPEVPEIKSAVSPIDLSQLTPASPDLRDQELQ